MKKIFREFALIFIIVALIAGLFLLLMGIIWFWFRGLEIGFFTDIITQLENWNAYTLAAGLILFLAGVYYLYCFEKDKRFVLNELRTDKRSELIKKHKELRKVVKRLPSKYQSMLKKKEEELRIR
jgi:signal transduction histidine kinase